MRVIFMGSPDFSVPVLQALVAAGHEIACVYCQPPRPAGRGKKDRPTPVQACAEALGLPVRHPASLKTPEARQAFAELAADVAVVVAYGLILPQDLLDAPRLGCLNIHASLLPRWRGAAPIHRAILAGDRETGICIMQMEAGLDTGPVLLRETTPIAETETTADLHDRLSAMGARLILRTLDQIDSLDAEPQADSGITYAEKIDKTEAAIDWNRPAAVVSRQINGLSPFPGAWTTQGGERLRLLAAEVLPDAAVPGAGTGTQTAHGAQPGEIIASDFTVACATGAVRVTRAQRPGKGAQDAESFLRGHPLPPGTTLGEA
jgi:methionyl-tRNA formyltransferase